MRFILFFVLSIICASCVQNRQIVGAGCRGGFWHGSADGRASMFKGRAIACPAVDSYSPGEWDELKELGLCDDGCYCVEGAVVTAKGAHLFRFNRFCDRFPPPPAVWVNIEEKWKQFETHVEEREHPKVGRCDNGVWRNTQGVAMTCMAKPLPCISRNMLGNSSKEELDALGVCGSTGKGCQCIDGGMFTIECQHLPMWDWTCQSPPTQ